MLVSVMVVGSSPTGISWATNERETMTLRDEWRNYGGGWICTILVLVVLAWMIVSR